MMGFGKRFVTTAILTASLTAAASPFAFGQVYTPAQPGWQMESSFQTSVPQLTDQQIDVMTASIALYPDPLLAVMLPAATYPEEILSANRWVTEHPNADAFTIDQLPYQSSVKSLIPYPSVLRFMSDNYEWTRALGLAFVYQQGDVLNSIQRWRMTAQNAGTLVSTPEQQILHAGGMIQILPAAPELVYVPVYDPNVVYVRHHRWPWERPRSFISFHIGGRDRRWLDFDLDWRERVVRVPVRRDWVRHHHDHRDWGRNDWDRRDRDWDRRDWDRRDGDRRDWDRRDWDRRDDRDTVVRPQQNQGQRVVIRPQQQQQPRVTAQQPAPAAQPQNVEKRVFVRERQTMDRNYPMKIVVPQPDRKVLTLPSAPARAQANPARDNPGRGNARGRDNNRGRDNDRRREANNRD